tara:strand:- start:235818 stop:236321 length:504 start_codon:yes stop_codon:yes gene_type:complete
MGYDPFMVEISLTTFINAPQKRVFDLARSIDAHTASTSKTKERAVDGVTAGLIGSGETVTWEARHLGIRQRLKVRVTEYKRPIMFTDEMVFGAFKSMKHTHRFNPIEGGTEMTDELFFEAPLGILGIIIEQVLLGWYMKRFLVERNRVLKELAESDQWQRFAEDSSE